MAIPDGTNAAYGICSFHREVLIETMEREGVDYNFAHALLARRFHGPEGYVIMYHKLGSIFDGLNA